MRKVINLTTDPKTTSDIIEKIFNVYGANKNYLKLTRGEEKYTVKYRFADNNIIVLDVIVAPDCYRFHVAQEMSVLRIEKPLFKPFDVGLSIHNNAVKYHESPYQKDARDWLKSKGKNSNTDRATALVMLATVCEMIWSLFIPCMKTREYADTIEYAPRDDFMTFIDEYAKMLKREYMEKHRLDGWDVVSLTQNQLQKMGETLQEHKIEHDFDNIAIHKFCLALTDKKGTMYYFMTHNGHNIHFDIEDSRSDVSGYCDVSYKKQADGQLAMELQDKTNIMTWLTKINVLADGEQVMYWQWMIDVFFSINSFMLHYGDVTMEVETKEAIAPSESKHGKKQQRNTVRLFKSYKLIKNWKTKARKKAEITCLAWGVRGHFRHLRNGKVIFVDSYIKGREKDKYKGKEYALLPYKDA